MEWLLIFGLAVWLLAERSRVDRLERRLDELERRRAPVATPAPFVAPSPDAAAPERPVAASEPPLPPVARPILPPPPPPAAEKRPARTFYLSNWLAENGLAWLGGGALALGGLFLVVYASQRGFFTPPMRIAAAVVAGALMLAASEWIRRQTRVAAHPLAAAAAAGAGGATLYGAIWSAHQLYHLIPFEAGAGLLVLCSFALLAYALVHGEALAVLAIFGAFAAPVVTGVSDWRSPAPEAYLTAIIATGFAFSALRGWARAGYATIAGAVLWAAAAVVDDAPLKAALLLLAVAAGACLAVFWRARSEAIEQKSLFGAIPVVGFALSSVLALLVWLGAFPEEPWTAVFTVALLSAIGGVALVRGLVSPYALGGPIAASCFGLLIVAAGGPGSPQILAALAPLVATPVLIAVVGWATGLRLGGRDRLIALAAASLGAAFVATLARFLIEGAGAGQPWAAGAATGVLMFAGAWVLAGRSEDASTDRGLALWLAGTVELLLLAVAGATPTAWEPVAHAAAAAVLVIAAIRLRWLGLAQAAVAASLFAFASMLRPSFFEAALGGTMPMAVLALSAGVAVAILASAGFLHGKRDERTEAEGLLTAALLVGLLGAFFVIERLVSAPMTAEGAPHLAASLRTVLLLAATLVLATRQRPEGGWLARWRLRILLIAGLAHGLVLQALALGPWWGWGEPPQGLPVLNTLLLAYLAPAGLLAALYRRRIDGARAWTRGVAVGVFLFSLLWAVLTVRHGFHPGAAMDSAGLVRNELVAYVVLLLAAACALVAVHQRRSEDSDWLARAAQPVGWAALAATAVMLWLVANPWWGVGDGVLPSGSLVLLFALYTLSAAASALLQRQATGAVGEAWAPLAQAAVATTTITLFVLVTLGVRSAFHGHDLNDGAVGPSLETWAYSAVWALFGLATLVAGGHWRNYTLRWLGLGILLVTVAKVLLVDTSRLDGMIRAASFLALGVLLIVGALAARRLNARALLFAGRNEGGAPPG